MAPSLAAAGALGGVLYGAGGGTGARGSCAASADALTFFPTAVTAWRPCLHQGEAKEGSAGLVFGGDDSAS